MEYIINNIPKGRFFWFVFNALIHWCLCWHMPKACPYVKEWLCPRLLWETWIIAYYQSSHRFNEIQREDGLWKFVLICGWFKKPRITRIFFCWIRAIILVESCWICVRVFVRWGGVEGDFLCEWGGGFWCAVVFLYFCDN